MPSLVSDGPNAFRISRLTKAVRYPSGFGDESSLTLECYSLI